METGPHGGPFSFIGGTAVDYFGTVRVGWGDALTVTPLWVTVKVKWAPGEFVP